MKTYKSPLPEITLKYKSGEFKKTKITMSIDIVEVVKNLFDADTIEYNESFIVLFLNGANNTVGWTKHSSGGTAQTVVDVKIILTEALLCGASSIAVSHNHPSGQLYPSREDECVTRRIKTGCDAIGIRFLDHIIIAGDNTGYYSFADEGKI